MSLPRLAKHLLPDVHALENSRQLGEVQLFTIAMPVLHFLLELLHELDVIRDL